MTVKELRKALKGLSSKDRVIISVWHEHPELPRSSSGIEVNHSPGNGVIISGGYDTLIIPIALAEDSDVFQVTRK